ncbi:uncharacterized protein BX663DRAFT_511285 [Cokeromyces recurvatus]|uniref:uncharacterized protein n=1 Tax=Cokeromyces recurvatus TaxID=90255 RepID=UPI00221E55A9|nr:uncharacterized protein BX663DRAFT_511285 [Cokeromyces recurvatus]KAI7902509.1 hypothetical protein BX663DRAFT_511285 [Cokeromyces recurvatus]
MLETLCRQLHSSFHQLRDRTRTVLFSSCGPNLISDPILWLPMTHRIPKVCSYHPYVHF